VPLKALSFVIGNPICAKKLQRFYIWTADACVIGLPAFMIQLAHQHCVTIRGLLPPAAAAIVGGIVFQKRRKEKDPAMYKRFYRNLVVFTSFACITNISWSHSNYYGLAAAFAYNISIITIGLTGSILDLPAIDMFNYGYIFFNYFAVKAIID